PLGTIETLHTASYIELPVLLRAAMSSGTIRWGFLVGPTIAFETNEQIRTTGDVKQSDNIDELKGTDIGFALGIEMAIPMGPGHITGEPRYTLGFSDIEQATVGDNGIRNTAFTVMAGYAMPLGR